VTPTAREEPLFLMTPAQHREWARILHRKGKPEKARLHEELARAIEIVEKRRQQAQAHTRRRARERNRGSC
jgi:uncharacterized protein with PIN domain